MAGVMGGEQSGAVAGKTFMSLRDVMALAEQKRDAGLLGEAESLCRQILQSFPQNAPALHLLGIIAHQSGNAPAGIELLQRAVAAKGDVALYYSNLGEMLRLSGRAREAVAAGRRAIELDPNHPSALNNLGIAYFDIEDYAAAEQCYRRAIALDPGFAEAYSNLGNALRTTKRLDEAVEAYNRAIALRPNYAEAYNNLGTALRDQKKAAESEPAYLKALALKPDDPPTLNNLALALLELDREEEAVQILTRSSALDPRNGRTYVYLGSALFGLDRVEEAEAALNRALALIPDDPDALNLRGRILLDQGKPEAAVASFQAAIAKNPDMVDAHNNLGNALKELGRVEEAMESYYTARRIEPKATAVFINLVDAKSFKSADDPDLLAMEELAKEMPTLSDDDRMQLHFALAKAYGDLKRHGQSFEHMLEGCALKRQKINYPEKDTLWLFDRIREVVSAELIRSKAGLGDPTDVPIFILGMPRSGSTLVEQVLSSHPKVFGAGELKDFDQVVKAVHGPDGAIVAYPEFVPSFGAEHFRRMGAQYLRRLRQYSADAPRITNKMPSSFFYTGLIHLALPNARIIHTMRNPVDTCLSCFSKLFSGEQNFSYDLGELGRYYRKYTELMEHWRHALPPGVMLDVQYEEVVEDFETQARRIVAHCGLEWDDACL
ncbi:MAG TPA: tetratricopeptide repeat protein, partial [Stellaceae bacterium]|nr:tetratricopeptide repeat protein [Stellaceae bacterium]